MKLCISIQIKKFDDFYCENYIYYSDYKIILPQYFLKAIILEIETFSSDSLIAILGLLICLS